MVLTLSGGALAQIKEGATAPLFSASKVDGGKVELAKYSGKVVLLNFWATWCTPCQTETPRFVEFQRRFGGEGLQVIGVSMDDSAEPVRAFRKKFQMNYPVAMGTAEIGEKYGGVLGLPITFLIGRDGKIEKRYEGSIDLNAMERDIRSALKK